MSANLLLEPGARLQIAGRSYVCRGRGPGGKFKLYDEQRSSNLYLFPERLQDYFIQGRAKLLPARQLETMANATPRKDIAADLSAVSEKQRADALYRHEYVLAVKKAGLPALSPARLQPVIDAVREKRENKTAPHWRTLAKWVNDYDRANSVMALVTERRGNAHGRFSSILDGLIEQAVDIHFLTTTRLSLKETHQKLAGMVDAENELIESTERLPTPSYRALRRYVSRLDKFDVMARRFGERYARRWFKAYGAGAIATRINEIWQVDHTILDVEVVYLGLLRLGKPTITVVLDTFTRMVMAMVVTFEPASYLCVMEALEVAILPKDRIIAPLKTAGLVRGDWPAFGTPSVLLLDNGTEFRGLDLKNAAAHLDIDLRFCPPRSPWFKGAIERFLLTLKNSLIAQLPSRTFPVGEEQGDREPSAWAIDLDDLQNVLHKWVVDLYHQTPHSISGQPPIAMFNAARKGETWF